MTYFNWDASYSVNVQVIDQQHQRLVGIINELYDAMKSGQAKQKLSGILDSLVEYTQVHFAYEEKLLETHDYPELWRHRKEHNDLVKQVLDFKQKYEQGTVALSVEMGAFLKDWLVNHILKVDKRYSAYLNQKGVR